jgi:hypothetical protein
MDREKIARELVKLAKELTSEVAPELKPDGKKYYYEQDGIGKAKYTVSYHDGKEAHRDGSRFYGIATFTNKKGRDAFVKSLKSQGYKERPTGVV